MPAERVDAALRRAADRLRQAGVPEPQREARALLAHALRLDAAALLAHPERGLTGAEAAGYRRLVGRRARREPFAYITGRAEFYSLEFAVSPAVLIPRPETELLVEWGLRLVAAAVDPWVIEVGTGSGAVAIALARHHPTVRIAATDVSAEALTVAAANARQHGVADRVEFYRGDLLTPLPIDWLGRAAVVLSNPPYVAQEELAGTDPEVTEYEPRLALVAAEGGGLFHRRLIEEAPAYLTAGGALLMEVGCGQAASVAGRMRCSGRFGDVWTVRDLAGIERVVGGSRRREDDG